MGNPAACTDLEFIKLWKEYGSAAKISRALGVHLRNVFIRRNSMAMKYPDIDFTTRVTKKHEHQGRILKTIENGTVVVFSDAHYYPDLESTAHRALIKFIKQFKPNLIVCNGDAFDGSTISRYPRIGWDNKPTVKDEISAVKDRLDEIEAVTKADLVWTLGNHDARYETFLAANSPQYEGVNGFTLKDHFPRWSPAWSCWVNSEHDIPTVIKHRYKGGIHATHNNTVGSGTHIVTGHLHSLKVTPYSDYNGTRYGVDTGTLADPNGPQFLDYSEDSPKNHRSGFAILTYKDYQLLPPELVQVWNEEDRKVSFRGALIEV